MKNILIIFTSSFPFGNGEAFLESELGYLSISFSKIIIVSADITSTNQRSIPSNVSIIRKSFELNRREKFQSISTILSIDVLRELFDQKYNFGLLSKRKNLNYLVKSWYKSRLISSFIGDVLEENKIQSKNTCLYSYWWLDEAIGIAQFKKKNPEVIAFSRCHGYDVYTERAAGNYLPLKKVTIKYLDQIYAISDDAKNYIDETYIKNDNYRSKISVSRLGVKEGQLKLMKENSDTLIIASCSAIYPNKRVDLILESILKLKCKVKWIHFGGAIEGFSDEYFEGIMSTVRANNNQNIEIILTGNVTNRNVLEFYANNSIDLFLNLSESEGIPVSIMEAMSYSIPVFATCVGGVSEIVNEFNGGLLDVNISSIELSIKLDAFFTLYLEEKNEIRKAAFETYKNHYNASINYHSFIDEIYKLQEKNEHRTSV
jgi:glycosyltransferase involved in cell wall biosynthesis